MASFPLSPPNFIPKSINEHINQPINELVDI